MWLDLGVLCCAYAVGSLLGANVAAKMLGGLALREHGSGNVGATNALRTNGFKSAALVLFIDALKAVLVVGIVDYCFVSDWLPYLAGMLVVLGHIWPLWSGFSGGKGAASLFAVWLVLQPMLAAVMLGLWLLCLLLTGYAGLSVLMAVFVLPFLTMLLQVEPAMPVEALAWFGAALMGLTHRVNLQRMTLGKEVQFKKIMLWRK